MRSKFKDSKGETISCGDILAYSYFGYDYYLFEETGTVVHKNNSFKVNGVDLSDLMELQSFACKIVGNIFEQPLV